MSEHIGAVRGRTPTSRRTDSRREDGDIPVITAAEMSYADEMRMRKRRYLTTMMMRIPLLVLGVIAGVTLHAVWLALIIIAISLPLPWIAVLIANDRPAKKSRMRITGTINHERALPAPVREVIEGN